MKLVSVIIVNYNGIKWLEKCLATITDQTYKNIEIIFVDNASTDSSVEYVSKNFPDIKLVKSSSNLGFASGNNLGYKHAAGEYIILLNNDTYVEHDYVEKLVDTFSLSANCGIGQSKLILMNRRDKLDSAGSMWTHTSFLYHMGYYQDVALAKYNFPYRIFSAKGASMIIKREIIDKIGLFDDTYWSYYEETDFCHRALLAGYETWYNPKAVCYHAMGATSSLFNKDYIVFHSEKNKLRSYVKNLSLVYLFWIMLVHAIFNLIYIFLLLLNFQFSSILAIIRAYYWNIINLRSTLSERRHLSTIVKSRDIDSNVTTNPNFRYFIYLFSGLEKYKYND